MTDFRWRVEYWNPSAATWTLDGNESLATGIASRFEGTAEDLAERLLRNWTDEPGTAGGRWRATIWEYDPARPPGDPAATKETARPAAAEADPCTVTGYFVTNTGPTLHYTLTSPAGHVLGYWRNPDGNVGAQIKAGDHWTALAGQDHRYQAVIEGVREYEARNPHLAGYNNPGPAARPEPGTVDAAGRTRLPVTIPFSLLPRFERAAPDGRPATVRLRWPGELLAGDVIEGLRDLWAVVAHVTRSGPEVTIRVQEAGGSRTMALDARKPDFGARADLCVDPATIPDIPDGFPPRWGVWRNGPLISGTLAWHPEPGEAAEHARQASRDGREYVVEMEAPDGTWTQVDAYQQGRRSAWGTQLAAGLGKTAVPPWATPDKDETADRATGQRTPPAGRDEAERDNAPAGRTSAPGLAVSSFPAHVQTGPPAAPPGPAVRRARQNPPDQAQWRRR